MMLLEDFDVCCVGLDSSKVIERRKNAELLKDLLNKPIILKSLNDGDDRRRSWDVVYSAFHRFIKKEGEKLHQDELKQAKSSAFKFRLQSVSDTFLLIINKANTDETRLSVNRLVESCIQCFECTYMKKYFGFVYLKILIKYVLPVSAYWGKISDSQWKEIFVTLKGFYKNPDNLDKESILRGLYLTIKFGCLHSTINILLQGEFEFIQNVCVDLTNNTNSIQQQINSIHLLISFSELMSKDYRMATSKLGEELSRLLLDFLYHLRHEHHGGRKGLIFDYLLLQMRVHHPRGSTEDSDASYCYNSENWRRILRSLYSVLCNEVDVILRSYSTAKKQENFPELRPNFLELFVEVAKQVFCFNNGAMDITQSSIIADFSEVTQPFKKRRVDIGIVALVDAIQNTDNWPWLSILAKLLDLYPEMIEPHEFLMILETLASLQAECKDAVSRHYLYKVLIGMVAAEKTIDLQFLNKEKLDLLWTRIWETSLRSIGLNQNEETTHKLIQTIFKNKTNSQNTSLLLSIYLSDVINISQYSIDTLHALCESINIPEYLPSHPDTHLRKHLINFIINREKIININAACFRENAAQTLLALVLKTNPHLGNLQPKLINNRQYKSIEDIYVLCAFENGLLCEKINNLSLKKTTDKNNIFVHSQAFEELSVKINSFSMYLSELSINNKQEIIQLINGIALLMNLTSKLVDVKIIDEENIQKFLNAKLLDSLCNGFKKMVKHDLLTVSNYFMDLLNLKLNPIVSNSLRSEISVDFLKIFFGLLNFDDVDSEHLNDDMSDDIQITENNETCSILNENNLNLIEKLQLSAMRILTIYSCGNCKQTTKKQQQVLESLMRPEYRPKICVDFQMMIILLKSLIKCEIGALDDATIEFILKSLQKLMAAHYENFFTAIVLLKILKDAIPHIDASKLIDAKLKALILLNPFIDRKHLYGSELLIVVIECLGLIIKIDISEKWPENDELTIKLIEFLKCGYIDVRLNAIKNILNMFYLNSNKQEKMLVTLKKSINDSFSVRDNLSEDQLIDEAANRVSSALHLYAALIVSSVIWRKHFLFEFFQLIVEKKINVGLIQKVLKIITNYLNIFDLMKFLDENINYLLTNWIKNERKISEFPYKIFFCENNLEFYVKYIDYTVPILLLQGEYNILEMISKQIQKSIPDVIKVCYPKIIGQYLPIIVCDAGNILNSRRLFNEIDKYLNENESELLKDMLEQVFVQLLNRVYDVDHFKEQLNIVHVLPEPDPPSYNMETFQKTLKYIEMKISNSESLVKYCAEICPEKLERMLFELSSSIYERQTIEDKLTALHRYSILVDLISAQLSLNLDLNTFLVRHITNHLLNMINTEGSLLASAAVTCLGRFARGCLANSPIVFGHLLILIVSTLTPIAKSDTAPLCDEVLDVLELLIVRHSTALYTHIGTLDPFPGDERFAGIREVHERIKYGNERFSLEREVRCFLNVGDKLGARCDRTHGLQHLKAELRARRCQLRHLYDKLDTLRAFCQNSDDSILHHLICMLVELTTSPIPQVKLEAARCLGELGPSDLTTLVLKPEKIINNHDLSPVELICNHIIVSLSKYIVSREVKIAGSASSALYAVLASKEGNNVIKNYNNEDYGCGLLDKLHILPFIQKKKSMAATNLKVNEATFRKLIDVNELWCPSTSQISHNDWIITLVSKLLTVFPENTFLRELIPVCRVQLEFAEMLLPLIVFLLLTLKRENCTRILSKQMQQFFEEHWNETAINKRRPCSQNSIDMNFVVFNRASVQCMLNTVHFVRLQQNIYQNNIVDELNLNYLHVALGAQYCSAYFTSVLYAELWCYGKLDEREYEGRRARSILEAVCEQEEAGMRLALETMLREAYKQIGDADAVHGCGTTYMLGTGARIDYYKSTGRWDKLIACQKQLAAGDLVDALTRSGLHALAFNTPVEDAHAKYECAWRLNNWDLSLVDENAHFEGGHYAALRALHERDHAALRAAVTSARTCVISGLSHASLQSSKSLYRPLMQLKLLQDVEDFSYALQHDTLDDLLSDWRDNNPIENDFEYVEPIRAQRITMLVDESTRNEKHQNYLIDMYLQLAEESRRMGVNNIAQQCLDSVSAMEGVAAQARGRLLFEQAQLSWLWPDDRPSSRYLLNYILDNHADLVPAEMYGRALTLYGDWMVDTRSENPTSIIENYFEKSLSVFDGVGARTTHLDAKCDALNSLARFADAQYQQVTAYIASSAFVSKLEIIKRSRDMATKIKNNKNTSDERRAIALYEKQSKIDESEVNNAYQEKNMYLTLAIKNYLRMLEHSDSFNFKVFRVLSLSLDNKQNTDVLNILKQVLPTIQTYKFIPLLPQLVPHIAGPSQQVEPFERIVHELLERCALDHPHHTLPTILAVSDSFKDRVYDRDTTNTNVGASADAAEPRVHAAKELLAKLKRNKALAQLVSNMEQVATALISLAYVDAAKCSKRSGNGGCCLIPRNEAIRNIRHFDDVQLPTVHLEIRKNKNYQNIIGISEFSSTFWMVGGVNAPKKITCTGTDGVARCQLVKGKDDLRQDAVMQQVFSIMNALLGGSKQTSKLAIRTYKVVPLSQRSGVLEWCANTEPLGTYLCDAHRRYRPGDWTPAECRAHLRAVHTKPPAAKWRAYADICARLHPVMHMFFVGAYPQPPVWLERRRAYVRSVATTSMVGYVLGLGDRHVHNILLDTTSAELVHIDFGIAFEQGKCLPTPETVPFRLSRDIEAGMGVCGVDGLFRRSCEHTMRVLRHNAETVLTILQVLLYDPLYVWTITPAEAYSRQKDDDDKTIDFSDDSTSSNVNITAERALLRLKEKLQGMENGAICSVEGQVELLLQQARDPVNLSRLFHGWQPYL